MEWEASQNNDEINDVLNAVEEADKMEAEQKKQE